MYTSYLTYTVCIIITVSDPAGAWIIISKAIEYNIAVFLYRYRGLSCTKISSLGTR